MTVVILILRIYSMHGRKRLILVMCCCLVVFESIALTVLHELPHEGLICRSLT